MLSLFVVIFFIQIRSELVKRSLLYTIQQLEQRKLQIILELDDLVRNNVLPRSS
jgi:hypothetical protein